MAEKGHQRWIDAIARLDEKYGLRFSFDYNALVQYATEARAEDFGGAGEIRATVRWRPWGRDGVNLANVVFQGWHRHGYSDIPPSALGNSVGSLWPTTRGFNDGGWAVNHFYFEQYPELFSQIPREVWKRDWVVDVQAVGSGEPALKYLAAYVHRTAFSAEKILADDGTHITFTYRDNTGANRKLKLPAERFLHRFLQHVLPKGFQRVRHFGWLSPAAKARFERIAALLDWRPADPQLSQPQRAPLLCPCCQRPMFFIQRLARAPPSPP